MTYADVTVTLDQPVTIVAAFVVGVLAVARMTRLLIDDDFPPVAKLREFYVRRAPTSYESLVECPWCMSPWVALVDLAWAWGTGLHWTWWFANVWFAVAWLAAFLCARDIPPDARG
ncbi:MAG: hypothetical protein EHM24_11295 [Acidobacteria bacterium]|nr:MAG: hypothetical protein EHM24_11295 [Acidobacteriota bacterium]